MFDRKYPYNNLSFLYEYPFTIPTHLSGVLDVPILFPALIVKGVLCTKETPIHGLRFPFPTSFFHTGPQYSRSTRRILSVPEETDPVRVDKQ